MAHDCPVRGNVVRLRYKPDDNAYSKFLDIMYAEGSVVSRAESRRMSQLHDVFYGMAEL